MASLLDWVSNAGNQIGRSAWQGIDKVLPGDQSGMWKNRQEVQTDRRRQRQEQQEYSRNLQASPFFQSRQNQVNRSLDQGRSYEDIASQTGLGVNEIRTFADTTRPGYGVKPQTPAQQVGNMAAGLAKGVVDEATSIPRAVYDSFTVDTDNLSNLQRAYERGEISAQRLQEEADKEVGMSVDRKAVVGDGGLSMERKTMAEFGRDFANAGAGTAGVIAPLARGATVATQGQRIFNVSPKNSTLLTDTGKQLFKESTAWNTVANAQSAMNGQLTPETIAANTAMSYGLPFAGAGAARGYQVATDPMTHRAIGNAVDTAGIRMQANPEVRQLLETIQQSKIADQRLADQRLSPNHPSRIQHQKNIADLQAQAATVMQGGYIAGPSAKGFKKAQAEGKVFEGVDGKAMSETPKTVKLWQKSKFSDKGAYVDVPVVRKVDNVTLYQGKAPGEQRQYWTANKEYAQQFGEVREKTGSFYEVDNGNRVTTVYVEAKPQSNVAMSIDPGKQKLSRFANRTVQNSDEVSKPLKKAVKEQDVTYEPHTNAGRLEAAERWADGKSSDSLYNDAIKAFDNPTKTTDQDVVNAIQAAKKLDEAGGETNLLKATEVYDTLSRHLTKKGQEVQAASLLSTRSPQGLMFKATKDLKNAKVELTPERMKALDRLITEVKKHKTGTDEANFARYEFARFVNSQIPTGRGSRLVNFWRAGLLTAPTTTAGNVLGNAGEAAVRKGFVNPVAAGVDKLFSLKTGQRTITNSGGFTQGAREGAKKLPRFIKTGYDERNALSKYDTRELNYGDDGVGKLIGNYVNGTYRLMSVADQPFWYGARNEALTSIARAEALNKGLSGDAADRFVDDFVKNPPTKAMERATQEAKYATFQNETALGQAAGGLKQGLRRKSDTAGAAGDFFIPFTQVPASIATRIVTRTPVGTAMEAVKQIKAIKEGGKFDQRAMSQAIAEGSFGPAVFTAGYALANSGNLTFGYPEERKERELWEAEGKQPYSVRIGDRWYSLNYLQPFGTLLAIGGETFNSVKDGADPGEVISRGIATAGQAVMNQSFLKGVSGVLDAIDDPKRYAENYVENTAGSVIPNVVRSFARATDDVQREAGGVVEGVLGALPGTRQTLPEKQDSFGQPVPSKDNFWNMYLNPLRPSKVRDDDGTVAELRRLQDVDEGILPTQARKDTFGDKGELTKDQIRELNKRAGTRMKEEYTKLIQSDDYKALSDQDKAKSLKKINDVVFGATKAQYGQEIGLTDTVEGLSQNQRRYLEGRENNYVTKTKPKKTDGSVAGTSTDDYPEGMNGHDVATLKRFEGLSSADRKQIINKEKDAEYKLTLAEYERDKKNGVMSQAETIRRGKEVERLKAGKDFDKNIRELYGLSKQQILDFVSSDKDGTRIAEQLVKYGDALEAAGLGNNKLRLKDGSISIGPASRGGSGGSRRSGSGGSRSSRKGIFQAPVSGGVSLVANTAKVSDLIRNAKVQRRKVT